MKHDDHHEDDDGLDLRWSTFEETNPVTNYWCNKMCLNQIYSSENIDLGVYICTLIKFRQGFLWIMLLR